HTLANGPRDKRVASTPAQRRTCRTARPLDFRHRSGVLDLRFRHLYWKREAESCAAGTVFSPDSASMCFDDGTSNRQPETDAFLFCCEERVEKSGHEIKGNAFTCIAHGNLHGVPFVAGIDGQQSWVPSWLVH